MSKLNIDAMNLYDIALEYVNKEVTTDDIANDNLPDEYDDLVDQVRKIEELSDDPDVTNLFWMSTEPTQAIEFEYLELLDNFPAVVRTYVDRVIADENKEIIQRYRFNLLAKQLKKMALTAEKLTPSSLEEGK